MKEFALKEYWTGGPLFELNFVFEKPVDAQAITELILESGRFSIIEGLASADRFKSVFQVSPDLRLPIQHSFYIPSRKKKMYVYSLGLRPTPFRNLVGANSENLKGLEDTENLSLLVKSLVELVSLIRNTIKVDYATISNEDDGFANPNCDGWPSGLYISTSICKALRIHATRMRPSDLHLVSPFKLSKVKTS